MMNLKKFFYRDYAEYEADVEIRPGQTQRRKIDLRKSEDKERRKKISDDNEPVFKAANLHLTRYVLQKPASDLLDFGRQSKLSVQKIPLTTIYPGLFTGSGYTHETGNAGELKLGFFFDHTTGLPILPGSSVKGALRSAFPHFKGSANDPLKPDLRASELQKNKAAFMAALFSIPKKDNQTDFEKIHELELAIFEGIDFQATNEAREEAKTKKQPDPDSIVRHLPMSKHDVFLDAFISKGGKDGKILGTDAITPHGDDPLKNPIPLPFLKVLPEVEFIFQFLLKASVLTDGTEISAERKKDAFEIILTTFGAGAKTNVGYGQFRGYQGESTAGERPPVGQTGGTASIQPPAYKPLKKGEKVAAIVVEDPKTPPQHIALKLFAGDEGQEPIAYLRFPAGRAPGTPVAQVQILEIKPVLKINILKW